MEFPVPPSVRSVAAYDGALAESIAADFQRLASVATATAWAQARLPALVACGSATAVLELLVGEARALTEVPIVWAAAWEGDPDRDTLSFRAIAGSDPNIPAPEQVSHTVVGKVVREGRPMWSDDAAADARFAAAASVVAYAIRSVACVPVGKNAVLYLADPTASGRFSPDARLKLSALASAAAAFLPTRGGDERSRRVTARSVPGIIGETPVMHELFAAIHAFAATPWPALILGETGVGKESVARALHALSARVKSSFIAVNCGAIRDELADSTLFGHERGAFTGADRHQDGVVARVGTGTLFLDEVGELSPRAQVKLLRLLQEGTFTTVGGTSEQTFRGRIVAATHRPLTDVERRGTFRDDLYHRLSACILNVPPLRTRREDIPSLARHLTERACAQILGSEPLTLTRGAIAALCERAWPGNVRELENALRTAIALARAEGDTEIRAGHLSMGTSPASSGPAAVPDLHRATEEFVKGRVHAALDAAAGNRTHAAAALGVSRQWLHRLLARWEQS